MQVIIKEVQNINSDREGSKIIVKSLKGAKIAATNRQCFEDTVLKIEDTKGNLLAYKTSLQGWFNGKPDYNEC